MPFWDESTLARRIPFTPAERAVLVERTESMKVELDCFIDNLKNGAAEDVILSIIPCVQGWESIQSLIGQKVQAVVMQGVLNDEG